ncbi:MAG: DUF6265 family protein [Terriglobales bacterium]
MRMPPAMLALLAPVFLITVPSFPQPRVNVIKNPRTVSLHDLAFISGHSRGELDGGIADEEWSQPIGDTMMGMYCYVKDAKVRMYEMMVVEQTGRGPVLRLKHYNAGLQAWEEKTKVWDFPLVRFSPQDALFETADKSIRIEYRAAGPGILEATLEEAGKTPEVFLYKHSSD